MIGGANQLVFSEDILKKFSQEKIFEHCGIPVEYDIKVRNPLREDSTPGCHFEWFKNKLYFYDFTGFFGKAGINCLELLQFIKPELNTTYKVLDYLNKHVERGVDMQSAQHTQSLHDIEIRITSIPFPTKHYLDVFPSEFLYKNNVHYVSEYWCSTKDDSDLKHNRLHNPTLFDTYAFFFNESKHIKLYIPQGIKGRLGTLKFYTNCSATDVWGLEKIFFPTSNVLLITKGGKDYLTLSYLFPDYDIISVQSEYDMLPQDIIEKIKKEYDVVAIVFDPDSTGKNRSAIWKSFGFVSIDFDETIGDSYDYFIKKGPDFLRKTINRCL